MHPLDTALIQRQQLEEAYRQTQQQLAWAAYRGQLPPPFQIKPGHPNHSVQINFAALIIDKAADALFGQDVVLQVNHPQTENAIAYLERVWPKERRAVDLLKLAVNGGVFGHAWLELCIKANGEPRPVVLDSQCMCAEWETYDLDELTAIRHSWSTLDEKGRPVVKRRSYLPDGAGWKIVQETNWSTGGWVLDMPPVEWQFPFPPVYHCQNWVAPNEFYGWPDLPVYVIELIRAIARLDSVMNKIVISHSAPLTVVKGLRATQKIQRTVDGLLYLPDINNSIETIALEGDLAAAQAIRKMLVEDLHATTHIPQITVSKTENIGQATSGRALQILYGPLLSRTRTKRRLYGQMLVNAVKAILSIGGFENVMVGLQWPELLPTDPVEERNTATMDKNLGVASVATLAGKLGYDWTKEKPLIDAEAAESRDAASRDQNFGFQ